MFVSVRGAAFDIGISDLFRCCFGALKFLEVVLLSKREEFISVGLAKGAA
jgi:hypothetical protein